MELSADEALKKGVEAHQAGQTQEADCLYKATLNAQPKHPYANHNMGVLVAGAGKEAERLYKTILQAQSAHPDVNHSFIS